MQWIRAVGRITLGDGSHGTCFLISADGLVLTAFHVVAYRDQSLAKLAPVWRPGPIKIVLGDPNNPATLWDAGEAAVYLDRYSIDDDWAMLEVARPPADIVPLQLADYEVTRIDKAFSTFGFPTVKADIGGEYHGTVAKWPVPPGAGPPGPGQPPAGSGAVPSVGTAAADANTASASAALAATAAALGPPLAELDAINLEADAKGGEDAGGISGAPCVVDNRAVAIVLRSLANARGQALARSLYAVPLAVAAHSLRGLVPWDDGKPVVFQKIIERKLPSDPLKLEAAAGVLGLPGVREKSPIARRMLARRLETARDALVECDLDGAAAGPILERVAAMRLNADAVAKVRAPLHRDGKPIPALPILGGSEPIIHKWFVQRAYADRPQPVSGSTIVSLRRPSSAAELATGTPLDWILDQTRKALRRRKLDPGLIDDLLSPARVDDIDGMWLVLVGENRPDVIAEARDKLPNAQILLGLSGAMPFPPPYEDLAAPVYPVMPDDEQRRLVRAWRNAAALLEVPIEMEVDA